MPIVCVVNDSQLNVLKADKIKAIFELDIVY